jgi:arylsulfatase A-like enzyme
MGNRRQFLKLGAAAAATAVVAPRATAAFPIKPTASLAGSRPNIIFILADDMGYSDIGCYGSEIPTPNLDRLAGSGMQFSQFYNNPRCCPSRASIMTGLYPHQAGMGHMTTDAKDPRFSQFPQYAGDLSAKCVTIPEVLKTAGYKTAMVGKWHLTPFEEKNPGSDDLRNWPLQRGYDKFSGMIAGESVYFEPNALVEGNVRIGKITDPHFYLTDAWAEKSANFISSLAKGKDPFFLYCAFNAPHYPMQAPEADVQKYVQRYTAGWDAFREERHKKQLALGLLNPAWPLSARDPRVPAWPDAGLKDWEIRRMAVYAAMIDRLDQGIGHILAEVDKAGIADNTLIMFMSDNGGNAEELPRSNDPSIMPGPVGTFQTLGLPWANVANTPFRLYKHYTQEGGISTPFIAAWPKHIEHGARPNNSVGHETDLMPTFLEFAGAHYPASNAAGPIPAMVGESLVPLFEGEPRTRGPIFWEHEGNKAVRDGKWKLVSRAPQGWELYDMEADRTEVHDLAHAEHERVKAMSTMYDNWAAKVGVQSWPVGKPPVPTHDVELHTPEYLRSGHNK